MWRSLGVAALWLVNCVRWVLAAIFFVASTPFTAISWVLIGWAETVKPPALWSLRETD